MVLIMQSGCVEQICTLLSTCNQTGQVGVCPGVRVLSGATGLTDNNIRRLQVHLSYTSVATFLRVCF